MLTIPSQEKQLLGKSVGELMGTDVRVLSDGSVLGLLKHVTGFKAFNEGDLEEQSGNYFAMHLETTGERMTIKRDGVMRPDKENIAFDPDILLRVPSRSAYFDIEVDGKKVVRLNFAGATLPTA